MYRFNLTHITIAFSLTLISCGSAVAQVSASDAAVVREHVNKGNLFMGRGQWEQAIAEYEQALDADAGSMVAKENLVLVHNNWGISLFQHHKYEEAKAQWEEALKMNPYDRNAKQNLAVLKSTLARVNAAPKPPVKPPAEPKEATAGKNPPGPREGEEASSSGPKVLGQPIKQPDAEAASSGPKMLNATKLEESSSGPKMLSQPKAEEPSGGAVIIMNNHAQEVPAVPAPPAVPPTAPEPPQISAPAIDMSSPYSFVDTPAAKAEASSPYGMPANMAAPTARPRPYVAPPVTPARPANAWSVPASVSTETQAAAATTSTPTTSTEADSSANLEEQLGAIEIKLNGRKQKNMPILKRIEKLETSISGKANSGSLQERIDALRKSCGL